MLKVIIADDEKRILKLIQKIINWEELGLEIVGIANDGIEAIEIIREKKPHIVITDIRMPGYEGLELIERAKRIDSKLEFIIISGYGQFEYAKKAIEFEVKNYLLKPINKEELTKTLINVKKYIKENTNITSVKEDINLIRKSFLNNYFFNNKESKDTNISKVNEKYHFNFIPAHFNVILFKIDHLTISNRKINEIINNIVNTIEENLKDNNWEREVILNRNRIYLILNFDRKELERIMEKTKDIHNKISHYCYALNNVQVTIAYGKEVERLKDLEISFQTANLIIEDRILRGKNKIYKYDNLLPLEKEIEDIFYNFAKKFIKYVEILDSTKVQYIFKNFKKDITRTSVRGADLKDFLKELSKLYFLTLKNNKYKNSSSTIEYQVIKNIIEDASSVGKLFDDILQYLSKDLDVIINKRPENILQIRKAKKYIEDNYMNNIKLEDLGEYIGLNPSYFSSIFKKETGTSFIEYLSMVRVENAKDLLKESDLKIQDISRMIGYNDSKYFTKIFAKYSGLKPKEYRKLFI